MHLHQLLHQYDPALDCAGLPDPLLTGVCEDSRFIQPGHLFIARPGQSTDGARFVAEAKSRGAVAAVMVGRTVPPDCPLPAVAIDDPGLCSRLGLIARGHPDRALKVLGVTGTNGKTTTTYLIRQALNRLNLRCGLMGTVEVDDGRRAAPAEKTTPRADQIAELLGQMRDKGCRACAMEVSSHGLHQGRVAGVTFAGAGFTNLTQDHLDYHKTMAGYADAKALLFAALHEEAVAAVNADSDWTDRLLRDCKARIIRYSMKKGAEADYQAVDIAITAQQTHFVLVAPDGKAEVRLGMIGRYNVENALCAAALLGEAVGLSAHQIALGLQDATGAPGRVQPIRRGQPFAVLVDYAHTEDALRNVLGTLRPLTRGRLRVLFGCGGNRDPLKRPRMARACEELADDVYVTTDNPRHETPEAILADILPGFSQRGRGRAIVELDRRTAIERILAEARPGDVVLLAGKGHENYQEIAGVKHPFDDAEEARNALARLNYAAEETGASAERLR